RRLRLSVVAFPSTTSHSVSTTDFATSEMTLSRAAVGQSPTSPTTGMATHSTLTVCLPLAVSITTDTPNHKFPIPDPFGHMHIAFDPGPGVYPNSHSNWQDPVSISL